MAKPQEYLLPNPQQLEQLKQLDPSLPALAMQIRDRELRREFLQAAMGRMVSVLALILVLGGYVYLVMHSHTVEARILLGTGVLGLVVSFLRARLQK